MIDGTLDITDVDDMNAVLNQIEQAQAEAEEQNGG